MRRRKFLLGAPASLGATVLAAGCVGGINSTDETAEIADLLARRVDVQKRGTGALVSVVRPWAHDVVSHGGLAVDDPRAPDEETVFQIASLTKVFTALLLADAVGRGEVALDDPVARHIPAAAPAFEGRPFTLLDLATHGAGLPLRPASRRDRSQDDPYAGYSHNDLHADLEAAVLTRPPGAVFEYSNFGYAVLGDALQHRLGVSYEELVQRRILEPLGMEETRFEPTPAMTARMLQGYDIEMRAMRPWRFGALAPAGGLFSTAGDLRKFLRLWIRGGEVLLTRAGRRMLTIARPGPSPFTSMALGWRVSRRRGSAIAWSTGSAGGVRSFMGFDAEANKAVVAFINMATSEGMDDIGLHALDRSREVDVSAPRVSAITVSDDVLDRYVGIYTHVPGDSLAILRDESGLTVLQWPDRLRLLPETPTLFFLRESNVTIEFEPAEEGRSPAFVLSLGGREFRYERVE